MRPQYSLPNSTVVTTENTAKRYQPRLYLKMGRFPPITPKMFTMDNNWLL